MAVSPYSTITPESIKAEMRADLSTAGVDIDTREGSYTDILLGVAAYQIYKAYQCIPDLLSAIFPDATSGDYLDRAAEQIGLTRQAGTKATVALTVQGTAGTAVPLGTGFYDPQSTCLFFSTASAVLEDGGATITAEAEYVGNAHNLPVNRITALQQTVAGIQSVTNPAPATGGTEPESDSAFYSRYHLLRAAPVLSGNANQYVAWAKSVGGIVHATCIPVWSGGGTVKVIVAGEDRTPVSTEQLAACSAYLETVRPIGADITVENATLRTVSLAATVVLCAGATTQQVEEQLTAKVTELAQGLSFGVAVTLPYSRFLGALLQCEAVADYTALTVDGAQASLVVQAGEVLTVGTVFVAEVSA